MLTTHSRSQYNHQFERWGLKKRPRPAPTSTRKRHISGDLQDPDQPGSLNASHVATAISSPHVLHPGKRRRTHSRLRQNLVNTSTPDLGSGDEKRNGQSSVLAETTIFIEVADDQNAFGDPIPKAIERSQVPMPRKEPYPSQLFLESTPALIPLPFVLAPAEGYELEIADLTLNIGHHKAAHGLYRKLWLSCCPAGDSGPVTLSIAAACFRSIRSISQLEDITATHPELTYLYALSKYSTVALAATDLTLPTLLYFMMITEARFRLGQKINIDEVALAQRW